MKYKVGDRVRLISKEALNNIPSYKKTSSVRNCNDIVYGWEGIHLYMYASLNKEYEITSTIEMYNIVFYTLDRDFNWHPLLIEEVV